MNGTQLPAQEGLDAFIARLPKAELHLHIEGTLEPELMMKLASCNDVEVPFQDIAAARAARASFTGLQDFLNLYCLGMEVLRKEQDFYELADAYLARAAADGVRHSEIFFDPQAHINRGVPFSEFFPGLQRAVQDAPARHGLTASLIMCFMRDHGAQSAAEVLQQALPYREHILGVGLDSAEKGFPPSLFTEVFQQAAELGFKRMAHAGEEGGAENVWSAINDLGVDRIDHGVRCLDDPQLVSHLVGTGMALTVCPLSNLCLKVYAGCLEEKLRQLVQDTKVTITLNSDDPAYFQCSEAGGSYVNANYAYLARVAGLSAQQLAELAVASFRASFLPDADKQAHIDSVWAVLKEWQSPSDAAANAK